MESLKREVDLRPISRDLIRVRSEDLGFDPIKDRHQFQEKKDRYSEQQTQLQHHQRQWRLQKRKLHRRLLRKKQRLAEKQLSNYKIDETGTQCQYKRREAWIHGQINTISDTEEDSKSALMHMVEAPLEAHFLKGTERKREMKSEESDSMTEMSSTDDWDDSDLGADNEETFYVSRGKAGKSASFSTNLKHRLQCARCHIYYHYYHHGHYLANVHPHQPTLNVASQQSKLDARSQSVSVCSPCDHNTNSCLGSDQRPSWNRLRPSFAYESTISSQKHSISSSELQRSSSERCFSAPALTCQLSNKSRRSQLRWLSEESCNSDSEVTRHEAAVQLKHKGGTGKPSLDDNSESEYSTCDLGLYEEGYSFNYSGSFGGGNNYYVLVVVDDADASTDPGSENDDVAAGLSSSYVRDDSFDVEGSGGGGNVAFQPLSDREITPSQPEVSCPTPEVTANVSSTTQNCQAEADSPYTGSTYKHESLPSINVDVVSGSSERHSDVSYATHARVSTRLTNNVCNDNTKIDSGNIKEKSAVKSISKLPVATSISNLSSKDNGLVRGSSGDSLAFSDVKNKVTENSSYETCLKPGNRVMYGNNSIETRRRNFSSSSLPPSLMTATIEEVDDADYISAPPSADTHYPQRHSYSGSSNPPSKIPFRTLRRESRVPSMNSPPRIRRPGPFVGLTRSASENTYRVARLKDVDIVGESFKSRFPWQKDVAVQCRLPSDLSVQPNLQRALSGPAEYPYMQSPSKASNSPSTSPPTPAAKERLHNHSRSYSQSDLNQYPTTSTPDKTAGHSYHRKSDSNSYRTNYSTPNIVAGTCRQYSAPAGTHSVERPCNYQRNAFQRRSRSSFMEKSRSCDTSRQTSTSSLEYDDDIYGYLDPFVEAENVVNSEECLMRDDVLPSPTISPRLWAILDEDRYVDDSDDSINVSDDQSVKSKKGFRRHRQPRRLSSGSITSDAESENNEPDPPVARRGRRSAIYETKNCGDVSPTTLSPDVSPSNSCDEGEGASNIAERLRRRRSSVDLAMNIYPGDLLVQEHHKKLIKRNTIADFYAAGKQPNGGPVPPGGGPLTADGVDASKKGRQPFSLLKLMKTRSKESLTKIDEILKRVKPSEFKDNHLAAFKTLHWSDLIASSDKQQNSQTANISDTERKRREAVWELFKSECVFLIDHLMVLKHCFMEPLKKVQVEGSLMYAEPQDLFGNLDELSYVSYTFCKDFIAALLKDMSITDFGRTNVLLKAFQRFSAHSRDGAVYHSYCLNYTNALIYLEKLRANPEFAEFEKWCEQDPRCKRLQLTDLLVAPMQHCTKLPLLLHNVRKYTADEDERQQVTESIETVETSLKQLEEKMRWIKNFERVQEIQRQIVWPAVTELDPRCVIPESLKPSLSKQPCEKLLACPKRQLLHEGQITLVENPKPLDVHMFLFDDILLITKVKKIPRKSKQSNTDTQSLGQSDRTSYTVLRQPLALDRFTLHDISSSDATATGLKHCFALVHVSRYQQITGVFTFQAACEATKNSWLSQIKEAMDAYAKAASSRNNSFKENKNPKSKEKEIADSNERRDFSFTSTRRGMQHRRSESLKGVPTKSRSMDAVFI